MSKYTPEPWEFVDDSRMSPGGDVAVFGTIQSESDWIAGIDCGEYKKTKKPNNREPLPTPAASSLA
jgi:hypothetical protein